MNSRLSRTSLAFGCVCLLNILSFLPWKGLKDVYDTAHRLELGTLHGEKMPYEGVSPVWDIGPFRKVAMYIEPTVHYQMNSTEADAEWAALIPVNGGIVHAGPGRQPYMLSVFHQLRCLDVLRRAYISRGRADARVNATTLHCLNYIRQMVLCRRDTILEPVWDLEGPHAVRPWKTLTCDDWSQVYTAHARNARENSCGA
ncbi:hypothetical protein OH77DRAFT_1424924 [Trametes cingulata]|nr:hypothetical protein OH77DRAFT_1424924 [Trametes cingulata]